MGIGFNHIPIMDGTGSTITVSELFNIVNKYTVKAKGEITCVIFADNPLVIHVVLMPLNHKAFSYVQVAEISFTTAMIITIFSENSFARTA